MSRKSPLAPPADPPGAPAPTVPPRNPNQPDLPLDDVTQTPRVPDDMSARDGFGGQYRPAGDDEKEKGNDLFQENADLVADRAKLRGALEKLCHAILEPCATAEEKRTKNRTVRGAIETLANLVAPVDEE